jgi:hypothetical protein
MRKLRMTLQTLVILTVCVHCNQISGENERSDNGVMRVEIFENASGEFGYDIFVNEKLKIHQPHIPTEEGLKGFATRTDAEKTALAVVKKLSENQNPPTLTSSELEMMGVISGK